MNIMNPLLRATLSLVIATQLVVAQTADDRIRELEKRIEDLDRRLRVAEGRNQPEPAPLPAVAAPIAKMEPGPTIDARVTADTSGFNIKSQDGNFTLKIGADLQVDNRAFTGAGSSSLADTVLLRRVRPTFSGTVYKYIDYFIRPDFGQGNTVIYDAYAQLNYIPGVSLRVGKFKPPVGLERLQSDDDTTFVERGLPTLLVPSRDIGYELTGDVLGKRVNYAVGVFNGVPDNSLTDAAASSHRDVAARVFVTPVKGFGIGMGVSGGNVDNITLPAYKSFGQPTIFSFNSGVSSFGHRTRLAPQAYYYLGGFGLLTEYTLTEEGFQKGTVRRDVALRAWQVQTSYILTGEKKGFTGITPLRPFDPLRGGWGAFEVALRTGELTVEKGMFNLGFADITKSPRVTHEWVGGLNWYLNRLVRISVDYGRTNFGGGAVLSLGGNRPTEKVIIVRYQINFI
jgi:phosphate-selective porin OprO/OprP